MVPANAIGHQSHARAVVPAMPQRPISAQAAGERLIHFRVREGFRFAIVPAKAADGGEVEREIMFEIDAEAILARDMPGMVGNVWSGNKASLELSNRFSIDAHVCIICESQHPNYAGLLRNHAVAQFILEILRVRLPGFPNEINSIR